MKFKGFLPNLLKVNLEAFFRGSLEASIFRKETLDGKMDPFAVVGVASFRVKGNGY